MKYVWKMLKRHSKKYDWLAVRIVRRARRSRGTEGGKRPMGSRRASGGQEGLEGLELPWADPYGLLAIRHIRSLKLLSEARKGPQWPFIGPSKAL